MEPNTTEEIAKLVSIQSVEQARAENKAKKFIILGVKETNADEATNKANDEQQVKRILKDIGCANIAPAYVKRLKTKNQSRERPIMVELQSKENRNAIISASKRLKEKR